MLLRGLKEHTSNLTAIVTVADDGGSSGVLRERARDPAGRRHPQLHRRPRRRGAADERAPPVPLPGPRESRSMARAPVWAATRSGNLLIAAMTAVEGGDFEEGVRRMNRVLAVRGQVVPASATPLTLHAPLRDGTTVDGQSQIMRTPGIERVWLTPGRHPPQRGRHRGHRRGRTHRARTGQPLHEPAPEPPDPRDPRRLLASSAPRVFVCNVATQDGETTGFDLAAHIEALVAHTAPGHRRHRARQQPVLGPRATILGGRAGPPPLAARSRPGPGACPRGRRRPRQRPPPRPGPAGRGDHRHPRQRHGRASPCGGSDRVSRLGTGSRGRAAGRAGRHRPGQTMRPRRRGAGARDGPWSERCTRAHARRIARSPAGPAPPRPGRGPTAPFAWATSADHCRAAWLRGRFLARGSLSLAGGRTHLEFVVDPVEAPILAARLAPIRPSGLVAHPSAAWRRHLEERRGRSARSCAGSAPAAPCSSSRRARSRGRCGATSTASSTPSPPTSSARSRRPGRQLEAIATLEADGRLPRQPPIVRLVAAARRETPEATLSELAERLGPSVRRPARPRADRAAGPP